MTKYRIDLNLARHVMDTAPTIKTIEGSIEGHDVRLEFFDYGAGMGWYCADPTNPNYNLWRHHCIRFRIFLDQKRIDQDLWDGEIMDSYRQWGDLRIRRPSWLPKGMTIKAWNDFIKRLINTDNWYEDAKKVVPSYKLEMHQ